MFDWTDLAFASKKPLSSLGATFIAAPRSLSQARIKQLIRQYLPLGDIVWGVAKEQYIDGFDRQVQFETLKSADIKKLIEKTNAAAPHQIHRLEYFQRDLPHIIDKVTFARVVFVNGSWARMFHTRPEYYQLVRRNVSYELVSAFADEAEARRYAEDFADNHPAQLSPDPLDDAAMMHLAGESARNSFDTSFQTGAVLAKQQPKQQVYTPLVAGYNKVVPYQTHAMHHGSLREKQFAQVNDLTYYDTIHAEMHVLTQAIQQHLDLTGATLFVNLMPCPTCARTLVETDIAEVVYRNDHSDGYAVKLLEQAGKRIRRLV